MREALNLRTSVKEPLKLLPFHPVTLFLHLMNVVEDVRSG